MKNDDAWIIDEQSDEWKPSEAGMRQLMRRINLHACAAPTTAKKKP